MVDSIFKLVFWSLVFFYISCRGRVGTKLNPSTHVSGENWREDIIQKIQVSIHRFWMLTLFNANLLVIQKFKKCFPHWGESHPPAENLLISSPPHLEKFPPPLSNFCFLFHTKKHFSSYKPIITAFLAVVITHVPFLF